MIKSEFSTRFAHTFRLYERLMTAFDADAWLDIGRGKITPARLALHLNQSMKYYLEDGAIPENPIWPFWLEGTDDEIPSAAELIEAIPELAAQTEAWLAARDFAAENKLFPWAGETQLGVALFLFQHTLFHLGELSSLLNESKNGDVPDNFAGSIE